MISASLAVEGHAHGLGLPGHHPYMTYEPWRAAAVAAATGTAVGLSGPPSAAAAKPTEFLRPAPKPLSTRYNGAPSTVTTLNGSRMATATSPRSSKYPSPPTPVTGPVNLAQHKEFKEETVTSEEAVPVVSYSTGAAYSRIYHPPHAPHPSSFTTLHYQSSLPGPYGGLYPSPYTPLIRSSYVQPPPLSPLDTYSPPSAPPPAPVPCPATATAPSSPAATFIPPPTTYSPTCTVTSLQVKPGQSVLKEKQRAPSFKVPTGKEGSLKHRILNTRPVAGESPSKKRITSTLSPPATPTKPTLNTNNNTVPGNFAKGSLIQLANGELRRVEDMRTEDFVSSAEKNPELRLAESTVVRIEENPIIGAATITLSYDQNRTQVEFESTLEHPFFVYGQGWASCHPDRTLQCYGLKVHRLQVGDIVVSLTPREPPAPPNTTRNSTITTTATTTAMTVRQVSRTNHVASSISEHKYNVDKNLLPPPPPPVSQSSNEPMDASSSRKRRWSAPDQICDEDEQATSKRKD